MQNLYDQWFKNATNTISATSTTTLSTSTHDFLNSSQNEKNNWLNSSLNLPPEQRYYFEFCYIYLFICLFKFTGYNHLTI